MVSRRWSVARKRIVILSGVGARFADANAVEGPRVCLNGQGRGEEFPQCAAPRPNSPTADTNGGTAITRAVLRLQP